MRRFLVLLAVGLALIAPAGVSAQAEASRVRVLIAVDTDDQMGATWGLDGDNLKVILAAAAHKQGITARVVIETFTGSQMTPENILSHFEGLATNPTETLVFYYSGHGGYHLTKGHYLALTRGKLYRSDLLAAMKKKQPRLVVVLTDCCSNYAGGARQEEPPGQVVALRVSPSVAQPRAKREEPGVPKQVKLAPASIRIAPPPRPNTIGLVRGNKATQQEPPFQIIGLRLQRPLNLAKAKQEEPPSATSSGRAQDVTLITGDGGVPLKEIAEGTDGAVLRHLLFRHQGIVDANGCKKGALSHGALEWGGSVFTIGFMVLQKEHVADFDANDNRLVEWSEFFPALQKATEDAAQRAARGKVRQTPEASQLAQPVP